MEVALTIMPANVEAIVTGVKHAPRDVLADPAFQRRREAFEAWYELREAKANVEEMRRTLEVFR